MEITALGNDGLDMVTGQEPHIHIADFLAAGVDEFIHQMEIFRELIRAIDTCPQI